MALDPKGLIVTGADNRRRSRHVEGGVFAIGDVRSGSVKRVAAAVGEGAQVVATLHAALAAGEPEHLAQSWDFVSRPASATMPRACRAPGPRLHPLRAVTGTTVQERKLGT